MVPPLPAAISCLPPSDAHIWAPEDGCRGSVALQAATPKPDDAPEAREGSAAHWYVTEQLQGRDVQVGALAPNGHPVTPEMVDCGQMLLTDIYDTLKAASPGLVVRVEEKVFAPSVHEANWGKLDAYIMDRPNRTLHLWEYKFGHRFVDAVRNWQMLDYAVAVFDCEGFSPDVPYDHPQSWFHWKITLNVVQPRNYHPIGPTREWHLSGATLAQDYLPRLRQSAYESMAPGAPFRTGDHCRDCSARHTCPALQRAGALAMDVSLQAQPVVLPPHAVGLELRQIDDALKRLEARRTGLEQQALGLIRGGTLVPFFTTEHSSGRETWTLPADQVFALGENFGLNLRKPPEPITPAQARKAGLDDGLSRAFTTTPKGALRLKRVDDNAAALAFGTK